MAFYLVLLVESNLFFSGCGCVGIAESPSSGIGLEWRVGGVCLCKAAGKGEPKWVSHGSRLV